MSKLTLSLLSIIILLITTIIYILYKDNKAPIVQPPLATKVIHIEQMVISPSSEIENPDKVLSSLKRAIESKKSIELKSLAPTEEANQIIANLKSKVIENTPKKQVLIKKQPIIKQEAMVKKETQIAKNSIIKKNILIKSKPIISSKQPIKKEGKWETIAVSEPFTLEKKPKIKSPIMSNEPTNEHVPIENLKPIKTLGVVHVSKPFVENQ